MDTLAVTSVFFSLLADKPTFAVLYLIGYWLSQTTPCPKSETDVRCFSFEVHQPILTIFGECC